MHRILIVDDDVLLVRRLSEFLTARGWTVVEAADGMEGVERLRNDPTYEAILSDVAMPLMGGLGFLRAVRQYQLDVPVILMTGHAELESAIRAVEYGAFRYLMKPIDLGHLEDVLHRAVRYNELARLKRKALEVTGDARWHLGDRASLETHFAQALRSLWIAYQPIVSPRARGVYGYEALLRSDEPTLPGVVDLIAAAERLGRLQELGRTIRARARSEAAAIPGGLKLFVNLHPQDLADDDLYNAGSPLAEIATSVVLEITERASLDGITNVESRVKRLHSMGFQVAMDDLGAGYAGLSNYSQLEPDIAKIDMSLVRDIDTEPRKQSIVRSMKGLCDELGTLVVAEGIETPAERDTLTKLGCELLQGYLFAKPGRGLPVPRWEA